MFKINLNTFKFNKNFNTIHENKVLGKIIVEDQLYAVPIKYE